jgi:FixJ family two-component response regulator
MKTRTAVRTQKSIVIVDDDTNLLKSLERLLKLYGYAVQTFVSADSFISQVHLDNVSCIVLDIHLNGTTGVELRQYISKRGVTIPVIFITADDNELLRMEATETGCAAYLRKPVSPDVLLNAIGAASSA